ncbi:MAG: ACT domain-containing protein [Bdellovibrionales bacterium]|nr:ACT domain-containing protein [Bdellovibrionales bacterium]
MSGETNLEKLLKSMQPLLRDETFVFAHIAEPHVAAAKDCCLQFFWEDEGMAAILKQADAIRLGIDAVYESKMISLMVHSSLDAVGFLAAITAKLATAGISVNPVSAFYHDHLFVPVDKADLAMSLLLEFGESNLS